MAKIGRNEPCPCGSGIKYKKCCLIKTRNGVEEAAGQATQQVYLKNEIGKCQQAAKEGKRDVREVGVFIFFSTESGDGWLLEISEMDAVMVAKDHQPLDVELEENPATIAVEWSHTFEIQKDQFVITSYKDKQVERIDKYPTREINKSIMVIRKKFTADHLNKVHLYEQPTTGN